MSKGELNIDIDVLNQAVKQYGIEPQLVVAIEELAELQKILTKKLRTPDSLGGAENHAIRDNMSEEIADVIIMLLQLIQHYNIITDVEEKVEYKVDILTRRLQDDKRRSSNSVTLAWVSRTSEQRSVLPKNDGNSGS